MNFKTITFKLKTAYGNLLVSQKALLSKMTLFRGTQRRFPAKYVENTFQAIQSSFSSQEIHSKRSYKIGFCSVILGHFQSFQNYKSFRIIFPKILGAIYPVTNVTIFLIRSLNHIFESESFRVSFCTKNSFTWGVNCDKLSFRKS